jgi:hypothetical protein
VLPLWRALKALAAEEETSLQDLGVEGYHLVLKDRGRPAPDEVTAPEPPPPTN